MISTEKGTEAYFETKNRKILETFWDRFDVFSGNLLEVGGY